jgi:YVTN family beta-propeller protein
MATSIAHITWPPIAGSLGYLIEYKERTSSIWITPSSPANPTLATTYDLTINDGVLYDLRISSNCSNGTSRYRFTTLYVSNPVTYIWVEDTYTCAQDSVFIEVSNVTGLSSPNSSFYYAPQDRIYVIDNDDASGIFWWFDPNTFTSPSGRNYIAGTNQLTAAYITVVDRQYNRLYATGLFTTGGGLLSYDIPSANVTTVTYGGNIAFSRVSIALGGTNIYCGDNASDSISIIDRNTLTVTSTVSLPSVPTAGGRSITGASILTYVNGEIWVIEDGGSSSTNNYILRYNTSLTSLIGFIDISAYRGIWQDSTYWGKCYFDEPKNKFYVTDIRNSSVLVVDVTTNTVISSFNITNREGFQGMNMLFVTDPITNDLYLSGFEANPNGSPTLIGNSRTYLLDRDTLLIKQVYPNLTFKQLERWGGTNFLYGTTPVKRVWDIPNTGYNTDGIVTKFSR